MQIIKLDNKNAIAEAVACLKSGGILIYPTETCYGVGVDASNPDAVSKVLNYKRRPEGKPISIGVATKEMASEYVEINKTAQNIYNKFLPGPVTVVSKSRGKVDKRLESEKGTLGIRMPANDFILKVISGFGKPITTTSANPSGKKNPYSINDIFQCTSKKQQNLVDLIIDAEVLPNNPPSTVIDTTTDDLVVYRKGSIQITGEDTNQTITSDNVEDTINIACNKMRQLEKDKTFGKVPLTFLLYGDLGAGKTQFVKGIAKALGITQTIKSPTYTYVNEYRFGKDNSYTLYHFDAWRIQNETDLDALNFEEWFKAGNIIAIEWPSVINNLKNNFLSNQKSIAIEILQNDGETMRKIKFN